MLLCGWRLLIVGNCFAMGSRGTTTTSLSASGNSWNKLLLISSNNNFITDTGTPEKTINFLDEIDNEGTVSTCQSLNYYSSSPRNSEISTIYDITIATSTNTDIGHTASK